MIQKNEVDKYIKAICKQIPYKTNETKKFIDDLKANINNYVEDNQVKDIAEIKLQFGTEEEVANAFLEMVDTKTVKRKISIKRLITVLIIAVIAIWGIGVTISVIDGIKSSIIFESNYGIEEESELLKLTQEI